MFKRLYFFILKRVNMISYAKKIGVKVGNNVQIAKTVCFDTEPYLISIGDNSKITSNVRFVTHDGGVHVLRNLFNMNEADYFAVTKIGSNTFIGNNVAIMPGVSIGNNVIVGYGSIVTKNIPDNEVWAGVPAKKIETIDRYFEKKKASLVKTKNMKPSQKRKFLEKHFELYLNDCGDK